MAPIYLLLLPALVYGKITVYIDVSTDPPLIDVSGYSSVLLPEKERPLFKLDDAQLKKSVGNYSKAPPTDVFVRNGWGNLYSTFKEWREIKRTVKPTLETKTDTITSPQICKDVPSSEPVQNVTVSSTWTNQTIPTNESINYQILHDYDKLSFKLPWGTKIDAFQTLYFPAGKTVQKCKFDVYLNFEASIFGDVVANYMGKREGHHFWAFDVNRVQTAAGLPRTMIHQEIMTIEYYR